MSEDKIIEKLVDHDEQLEFIRDHIVVKSEFDDFRSGILEGQDKMIGILTRLDDERVFTMEWVKKIEREVEEQKIKTKQQEDLLGKIKTQLQIA